jgi:hypothetical protein
MRWRDKQGRARGADASVLLLRVESGEGDSRQGSHDGDRSTGNGILQRLVLTRLFFWVMGHVLCCEEVKNE